MTLDAPSKYYFGMWWLIFGVLIRAPLAAQESDSARHDAAIRAVVQLLALGPGERDINRECGATGFFVNEEGFVLTAAHVIKEAQSCLARGPGGKIMAKLSMPGTRAARAVSCDPVGLDEVHDLAVLKTERALRADPADEAGSFLRLDSGEVGEGEIVTVTGHPLFAWEPITQSGKVIRRGTLRLSESRPELTDVLVLNIPLRPGNSGSPVYRAGEAGAVAIIESQDRLQPSNTLAVPVRYAIELLNRHGVTWHAAQSKTLGGVLIPSPR